MAKKNIEFLGWQSDEKVRNYYRGCRAFIFPGEEDFGIAPVEAQACGSPVIAYERGGVLESVIPFPKENPTGMFFNHPTPESLITAVELFERNMDRFDSRQIRRNALRFNKEERSEKKSGRLSKEYQEFMQTNRTQLERGVKSSARTLDPSSPFEAGISGLREGNQIAEEVQSSFYYLSFYLRSLFRRPFLGLGLFVEV